MAEPAKPPSTSTSSSHQDPQPSFASPSEDNLKQYQAPGFSGFTGFQNGNEMFPLMYPAVVVGSAPWENQQQTNRGAGIYAVPVLPYSGIPTNTLIPLTYNIPTTRASNEAGPGEQGQAGQEQQHQQQQPGRQRQVVVRRFHIAFQLDLLLILKLAAVIFVFNQDGSRLRLSVLVFIASLIYLYQTGALTPLIRWLSQSMQRAATPPRPPRPAVGVDNVPAVARQEGEAGGENENQALNRQNGVELGVNGDNQWWGIVKEIQMIVFGFITSLLPGFHNID